jgi:hypothetical protein
LSCDPRVSEYYDSNALWQRESLERRAAIFAKRRA